MIEKNKKNNKEKKEKKEVVKVEDLRQNLKYVLDLDGQDFTYIQTAK
jgi:hypothetical protein